MKKLIIAAFLFITASCFAVGPCGFISAQYIGPSGGSVCAMGTTNCTSGFTPIGVQGAGNSCSDTNKADNCKIWVDTSGCAWSCWPRENVKVVRLALKDPWGNVLATGDVYMPAYRCAATFYVISSCTFDGTNWHYSISACDLNSPSTCTCDFLTGGGEDQ